VPEGKLKAVDNAGIREHNAQDTFDRLFPNPNLPVVNKPSNWLRKIPLGLLAAGAIGAFLPLADAQMYTATRLPTLGGTGGAALAINRFGTVAGDANLTGNTETHAISYSDNAATDLGTLGGGEGQAQGINSSGVVVGTCGTASSGPTHAFVFSGGTMTDLGTLGGSTSTALGIDDAGVIVGTADIASGSTHAFTYSGGTMTDLGTFGGPTSTAYAINGSGVIVGKADYNSTLHYAFSYSNGTMTNLGTLGGNQSNAQAISSTGYIVGISTTTAGYNHAFVYYSGTMSDLGAMNGATSSSAATGINSAGTIVGRSDVPGSGTQHAFVYINGQMMDLNSLTNLPGVILMQATGINDMGQIAAVGADGYGYLLTPTTIHLGVSAPTQANAASEITVTVTALDAFDNPLTTYNGLIQLSSSDTAAELPANAKLVNGTASFVVELSTVGNQTVTATDVAVSSVTGTSASITVIPVIAPKISVQPLPVSANLGANAAFWVATTGTPPLAYQWYFNDAPIPGATNPILVDVGVVGSSAGTYSVTVSNSSGTVISNSATLTVNSNVSGNPVVFESEPLSQTVASGATVAFSASTGIGTGTMVAPAARLVEGGVVVTYQWFVNGAVIPGATDAILVISGATSANNGTYTCVAIDSSGALVSTPAILNVVSSTNPGRLINLSSRVNVGTGANQLIAGYVVGGQGTAGNEALLIRASGPSLTPFGVTGVLSDPSLQLHGPSGVIASNSGWGGSTQVASTAALVGAFPWTSASSKDSALVESLPGGAYTAEITGSTGDTGVALAEIYDATPESTYTVATPRLVNLSARAQVGTGGNVLIAGFVIGGTTSKTVLIRASGPALSAFGVSGALPDPLLQLYQSNSGGTSTLLGTDAGWNGDAQIASTAASVGAFSWGGTGTPDSALLLTLPPGAYTAEISGASGDTGVALIEIYEVP
jgi:probable HAF family extracellular repeat protein